VGVTACGGSGASPSGLAGAGHRDPRRWLAVDAKHRRATIVLISGYDGDAGGFNIDGATKGALLFAVPAGWRVLVRCINLASSPYSCALARAPGGTPLPRAVLGVLHPRQGLPRGASATFHFIASRPAHYRLVAVTNGVEPSGMWVVLSVTAGGQPRVRWLR
jgi:hypothetical protein